MRTLFTIERPVTKTRRPCFSAASITICTREMSEANVATMTRPSASPITRSSVSATVCSEGV